MKPITDVVSETDHYPTRYRFRKEYDISIRTVAVNLAEAQVYRTDVIYKHCNLLFYICLTLQFLSGYVL